MQLSNFSIHASAKEATHLFCLCYNIINFQSTPPRRRRRYRGQSAGKAKFFNPRLREGGDSDFFGKDITPHVFSIHASAKEATVMMMHYSLRNLRFQSTPPRRRRQLKNWNVALLYNFQSTPPRRRRQRHRRNIRHYGHFSIHASAKEATDFFRYFGD